MKKFYLILFAFFAIIGSSFSQRIGGGFSYCIMLTDDTQSMLIAFYELPEIANSVPIEQRLSIINTNTGETISWFSIEKFNNFYSTTLSINKTYNLIKLENGGITRIYDYLTGELITDALAKYTALTELTESSDEVNNIYYYLLSSGEYMDITNDIGCMERIIQIKDKSTIDLVNIIPETYIGKSYYNNYKISADKSKFVFFGNLDMVDGQNEDVILSIYDVQTNTIERLLNPSETGFMGFNSDMTKLLIHKTSQYIHYFDFISNQIVDSIQYGNNRFILNIPRNNKYIILTDGTSLLVYDGSGQELVNSFMRQPSQGYFSISEDSKYIYEYNSYAFCIYNIETGEKIIKQVPNLNNILTSTSSQYIDISNDGKYLTTKYVAEDNNYYFISWSIDQDKLLYSKLGDNSEHNTSSKIKYIIAPYSIAYQVEDLYNTISILNKLNFTLFNLINGQSCIYEYEYLIEPIKNASEVLSYACGGILVRRPICESAISEVFDNEFITNNLELYPNPTKDKITIKGLVSGENFINIINTNGEIILEFTKFQDSNSEFTIDLSTLNSGNYIIELINGSNKRTGKISIVK